MKRFKTISEFHRFRDLPNLNIRDMLDVYDVASMCSNEA